MAAVNPRVFLDFSVDGSEPQRVVFELFMDTTPITSENERGLAAKSGLPLHFKGSRIHRVIQDFMIQGGDFTKHNGTGGESIYGQPFDDESFDRPVDQAGLLVMANRGPNTNGAQFFITVAPAEHLNGKHVCFGRVVGGYGHVMAISRLPTGPKDAPLVPVEIVHCGELQRVVKKPARSRSASVSSRTSSSRSRSLSASPPPRKKKRRTAEEKRARKERKQQKKSRKLKLKETVHQDRSPSPGMIALQEAAKARREEEAQVKAQMEADRAAKERAQKERRLADLKRQYGGDRDGEIRYRGRGAMVYRDDRGDSRGGMRGWAD